MQMSMPLDLSNAYDSDVITIGVGLYIKVITAARLATNCVHIERIWFTSAGPCISSAVDRVDVIEIVIWSSADRCNQMNYTVCYVIETKVTYEVEMAFRLLSNCTACWYEGHQSDKITSFNQSRSFIVSQEEKQNCVTGLSCFSFPILLQGSLGAMAGRERSFW